MFSRPLGAAASLVVKTIARTAWLHRPSRSYRSSPSAPSSLDLIRLLHSGSHPRSLENKKHVHIIYTGGTIGMRKNADGSLAPAPGFLPQVLQGMEELQDAMMPSYSLSEWPTLYDSSDMGVSEWNQIASDINEKYSEVSGFVVLCGTDTMAYAASALSFMLKNTDKPVIFTGSSIPFGEVHTDARRNLIASIAIAAFVDIPEVMIFFNEALMRGNRTRKKDSGGMDAFHSPKFPPLAVLGVGLQINEHLVHSPPRERFQIREAVEVKSVFLRLMPGYNLQFLQKLFVDGANKVPQAVILELPHSNPIQRLDQDFVKLIDRMLEAEVCVVLGSQCPMGRLASCNTTEELLQKGVVFAGDMTMEAVATKLKYAYGRGLPVDQTRTLMATNIRGELTEG